jgi:metal-dependent hydrolase (beta-lactamase superfamily II)
LLSHEHLDHNGGVQYLQSLEKKMDNKEAVPLLPSGELAAAETLDIFEQLYKLAI